MRAALAAIALLLVAFAAKASAEESKVTVGAINAVLRLA